MDCYFVTGASGVVGGALIPALLGLPEVEVVVLLRARNGHSIADRFNALKHFWRAHYLQLPAGALEHRLRAVAGDISAPALGLSAADQHALEQRCTHIVHCAASVRLNQSLAIARETTVVPTATLIALARRCVGFCKLEAVSTVGVGGRWQGPLPERWLDEPRAFHNTYEEAKAESEVLLREAAAAGLPLTVHRPSMVVGDSRTGVTPHFQIFQFICEFLSGRRTLGCYPALGQTVLDIVANDFVAHAIVAASRSPDSAGEIWHLCAGPSGALPLTELRDTVRSRLRREGRLPWWPSIPLPPASFLWLMSLLARALPAAQQRTLATLPVYLDYLGSAQVFDNTRTRERLQALGIERPDTRVVLSRVLDYYLANTRHTA
ncbi:MAG: SDR family oxidoreductase [Gammaproteobacteria bacterium]|jgi:thioester reductase-like protein|nr:SDR family oxidoreductase [Gammaproteobacteria bacterium]